MNTLAVIAGLGTGELVVILAIVLLLFGPKALPKLARSLGSSIREFKDATTKVTESVMADDDDPAERPTQPRGAVEAQQSAAKTVDPVVKEKIS